MVTVKLNQLIDKVLLGFVSVITHSLHDCYVRCNNVKKKKITEKCKTSPSTFLLGVTSGANRSDMLISPHHITSFSNETPAGGKRNLSKVVLHFLSEMM